MKLKRVDYIRADFCIICCFFVAVTGLASNRLMMSIATKSWQVQQVKKQETVDFLELKYSKLELRITSLQNKNARLVNGLNDIYACTLENTDKKEALIDKWSWYQGRIYELLQEVK